MGEMQDKSNTSNNTDDANKPNGVPIRFVSRSELARDEQAWTDRGNEAAAAGDYETAAEAFAQAVEMSPENARARYNLALAQQYLGDLETAIAGYRRAIDLNPELIDAYINLGRSVW